jgi:hypothetical protein
MRWWYPAITSTEGHNFENPSLVLRAEVAATSAQIAIVREIQLFMYCPPSYSMSHELHANAEISFLLWWKGVNDVCER